jgi:hypothetical protein
MGFNWLSYFSLGEELVGVQFDQSRRAI